MSEPLQRSYGIESALTEQRFDHDPINQDFTDRLEQADQQALSRVLR